MIRNQAKEAPAFIDIHERPLHLFVVSRDLARFEHVHPEPQGGGRFTLRHDCQRANTFSSRIFFPARRLHNSSSAPSSRLAIRVRCSRRCRHSSCRQRNRSPATCGSGSMPRCRLRGARLLFAFTSRMLRPVRLSIDLQPYLGAAGHALFVNQDLSAAMHGHPEGAPTAGPTVTFDPIFPAPGRYKVWVQFQRGGRVRPRRSSSRCRNRERERARAARLRL